LKAFETIRQAIPARRYSLANSAGICLGADYAFDLTRPGLALYGGTPRSEAQGNIRQVVFPEARVLQVRDVREGKTVGYGASWTARRDSRVVVANMGYADGFLRCHAASGGGATWQGHALPLIGRVSMDLIAFDASDAGAIGEGDWLTLDYDLPTTATRSGLSQYELLTGLGAGSSGLGLGSWAIVPGIISRLPDPPRRDPLDSCCNRQARVPRDGIRRSVISDIVEDDDVALPTGNFGTVLEDRLAALIAVIQIDDGSLDPLIVGARQARRYASVLLGDMS
jgi:hypothetical protein